MRIIPQPGLTSLCCYNSVIKIITEFEENQLQEIRVCIGCNTEMPNPMLFKISDENIKAYFKGLYEQRTQLNINRRELSTAIKNIPVWHKTKQF